MKKCKDIMTQDPRCCTPDDSIALAAQAMRDQDIGDVLVCQSETDKTLVGILTDRDITVKVVAEGKDPKKTTIEEVMSRDLVCCNEEDSLEDAIDLMERRQVRRIPVIDEAEKVVGIIAQADVVGQVEDPKKAAEVVQEISKPASEHRPPTI